MKLAASKFIAALLLAAPASLFAGELANIKVVTDASPDYSDMESMVRSITSNWSTDAEKMWALFYWDHIARRQTSPMYLHGYEVTDPIRQYNDFGFTMCSTISGIKCSTWNYMGYPCRFWEIGLHTVPDVWYENHFHHYDNSLSVIYTLCDGKTIAAVDDIGKTLACEASGGVEEIGHIAIYHSQNGTSVNGFLEGADTERTLEHLGAGSFRPNHINYQFQYYSQDRGHRYILNLRDGEVYTRYYARQDINSPNAVNVSDKSQNYKADPAYYVPNRGEKGTGAGRDPEVVNPRYHIRANGERTWTPFRLNASHLGDLYTFDNLKESTGGFTPITAGKPAEAVFKVEGANVITSLKIRAGIALASTEDSAAIAISTTNGLSWKEVWTGKSTGKIIGGHTVEMPQGSVEALIKDNDASADLKLIDEVNGSYEVLVKVTLNAKSNSEAAQLQSISFDTITEVNGHTQPSLRLGKNTVYVGNGEQTESIELWPNFRFDAYKPYAVDEKNVRTENAGKQQNMLAQKDVKEEGYVVFKADAPTDITSFTYGGRLSNRGDKSHIDFLHSFDGGKTWKQSYTCTDNKSPWDIIHYETITDIPSGTRSVLFKYSLNTGTLDAPYDDKHDEAKQPTSAALYGVHMEINHKLAASNVAQPPSPLEVTFTWQERQKDFSLVKRSHTQLVEKLPATYTINVGGEDHPIVNSLAINLKGSRPDGDAVKYGYSDGNDIGGEKFKGFWATYGKNLALNKPYTLSIPSADNWGAGDPDGKKLTDGRVGSSYTGGINMRKGAIWRAPSNLEIILDLGEPQKCAAFRIHTLGYEWWDSLKNESKDKIELLISNDGKEYTSVGFFKTNLRRIDIAANFMLPDDETFCAPNLFLAPAGGGAVEARYVKYKIASPRMIGVSEIQVLDSFEFKPFDLKIALPDPAQNGKAPPKPDLSPNAKKWADADLPHNIIGVKPNPDDYHVKVPATFPKPK